MGLTSLSCAFIFLLLLNIAVFTASAQEEGTTTILDLIEGNESFVIIAGAFNNSSLNAVLMGNESHTVFIPTNAAFANMSEGALESLEENPDELEQVLLYHVTNGTLMAEDLANMSNVTTLQGSELPVNITDEGMFVGNAKILQANIIANNGVIYVIDTVLIPEKAFEGPIELYNNTVNLTEGNFNFTPENSTQSFQVDNFTDIGALNATGLQYNVSIVQGMNMTNMSILEGIAGIMNDNTTGEKWFVYINGTQAEENFGMNPVSNGSNLSFWYTTEENGEVAIDNATFVANIMVAVGEVMEPQPGTEQGQNLTVLYNDTVNLTEGNVVLRPNATRNYTISNLTDFGALYATELAFNASLTQNMTGDVANMTNVSFVVEGIEGINNNNTTGEMWFLYINGEPAKEDLGMNPVGDGDNIKFWYTTEEGGEAAVGNATYEVNITVAELIMGANIIPEA